MKKNLFIIILSILSSSSYAQLVDGLPFNFSSLNGIQYNPGYHPLEENPSFSNMWVAIREEEDLSKSERVFLQTCFEEDYPGHTILAPPTVSYNCHGYSHSISQGGDVCNVCWSSELCNNGFVLVQTPEKGDIAVIRTIENNQFEPASIHSSIVVNEDTLISKWGEDALTKHHKNDVIGIGQLGTVNVYTYYRRVINTPNNISGPYVFNGTGSFIFYPDYLNITSCSWSVEPAAMFQVSSGTGYTANLSYKTPFEYLAPKATITFTFSYGCENHYTVSKEFDLRIPTTTISGNAISEGFILDANAVVTVTGTIKSNKNAKTIVPVGTRLILDGGLMTNNDNNFWQGIEVWGNSSMHQYTVNGLCAHGYLELKNGAVIENAKCAVELWRPNHWSTTGGIIHAIDATFKNNAMAVHALCYSNYDPNTLKETNYRGFLKNCSFIIDEDYLGTETFLKHVKLGVVNGIRFLGCDFSADRSVNGVHPWCIGISAYNAGFSVDSYCAQALDPCPVNDLKKSTFTGLSSGICVDGDGSTSRIFTVNETVFTNNDTGIKATNISYPVVHNNEFCIGRGEYCDFTYGIHLKNVSSFTIEDNYFHPYSHSNATTVGIAIAESRGVNDVYRNTFENLSRANLAFGRNAINTNIGPLPGSILGLTYTCNEYTGNQRDIMVLQLDGVACVQLLQGSVAIPAGNTFTQSGFQIYNNGSYSIEYYYNSNETDETPNVSLLYQVNTHGTTSINPCHTHYGRGALLKSASEKSALESDYLSAYSTYLNLKQLYESLIDGGNTANQIADINNATPADMWQLRARLLDLSPYVSGQVLASAAERSDIFSDPVLFEILAANPDELKNDSLIAFLENKTNPLPDYMIELLRQIASGASSRTALVAQIAKYSHDYTLAAGDIVRSNLSDTMANPTELRQWLGNMNDIAADRMVVASYLEEGDSVSAFALANMLPQLYGLQGNDLTDHHDYMRLINLYQTLKSANRTVYEMTETETATVDSIAELGTGISKSMAQSLLEQVLDTIIETCPEHITDMEEGNRGSGFYDNQSVNKAIGVTTNVGPNPATTWTTVEYTLPSETSTAILTLTNTLGINVLSTDLNGKQGNKVLDLRGLASGIYIYTIRYEQHIETGKLIITK